MTASDAALVRRWRAHGDQAAAAELYRRHRGGVLWLVRRTSAGTRIDCIEDLAQEVWCQWFKWVDVGKLEGHSAWASLASLARNASASAKRAARRGKRDERRTESLAVEPPTRDSRPAVELRLSVEALLERESADVRRAVLLSVAGFSAVEIAGDSVHRSTVQYRLAGFRRRLRAALPNLPNW